MDQKAFAPKANVTAPKAVTAPNPSLPKGGGAVRGLGEKFAANLVSGTGSLTVPIATSPGRGGFGPELSVAYDSGGGNGPFGVGFRLSVPSISRKTERGLPEYDDKNDSDTFILSGAEDLVRCDDQPGLPNVVRYRPRVEGLFARIERVRDGADVYWRAITKDNVTSTYGRTAQARVANPQYPTLVFSWLLERTEDARGNIIEYEYKAEDLVGVPNSIYEGHRHKGLAPITNRYLKRVRYGNDAPFQTNMFHFEVVFDYGEHDTNVPTPDEVIPWVCRQDPFSTYRATFEVRTYRLCQRALMFHRFSELGPDPVLVRSTDFTYVEDPALTRMTSVTQWGYMQALQGYSKKSLPPLEFGYSLPEIHKAVKVFDPKSMADIPGGVEGTSAKWVDLDGEGLPGVLCERQGAWYYKQNLGEGQLSPARRLTSQPSMASSGSAQLLDVGGEGRQCMVAMLDGNPGFHARTQDGGWGPFVPFPQAPNANLNDPRIRFIDLSGDGLDDILVTTDYMQCWFPSLGKGGWGPPRALPKQYDENYSPTLVFADSMRVIFVADMTGDGLQDIVRIQNGNICYWPNLGRGRFGAKVQMANAPMFDDSHLFDARRIRFADIDGTGTTDLVYVGGKNIVIAFNQAGNGFSAPIRLNGFPTQDTISTVSVLDLLGTGTACLVWSSPWRGVSQPPMRYIDLLNGKKPYLMTSVKNNMGAETKLQYGSSTKFYLEDLKAGKKWVTRLSFPVHVLERTETYDAIRKTRFVSTYKYHHGYYDAPEREFRGFGLVEQFDAESYSADRGKGLFADAIPVDEEFHVPPVLTKTWFHTGAFLDKARISKQFAKEYYAGDTSAPTLPDGIVPDGLSAKDIREACRALKGQTLRQEVYALDGSPLEAHPYKVTEVCPAIVMVQPSKANRFGSFFAYVRESVDVHYERNASDPRLAHTLALEVDAYGQVTKSVAIAYARRTIPALPANLPQTLLATITETVVKNEPGQTTWYRIGVPIETRTYEWTGLDTAQSALLSFEAADAAVNAATGIAYEVAPTANTLQKRLVEHVKQRYYDGATVGGPNPLPLAFGVVDALSLPYETYALAFTPGLIAAAFDHRTPAIDVSAVTALLTSSEGRYIEENGLYWLPTGRQIFDPVKFYHAVEVRDVFGTATTITYDTYCLLVKAVNAPLGNTITVENDYRVLGPVLVTDPNGNRGAAKIDELGMVIATAVMGKFGSNDGDTLAERTTYFDYNFERYRTTGMPNVVHNAVRETHGDAGTRWLHSYTYLDGLGGELMKKVQAEPGLAPLRDANGALVKDVNGELAVTNVSPRWVGTGRVVNDNKGNPIKQYEPFFSATNEYEDEAELVEWGVTPILRYDPIGRVVRTDLPDGTISRIEFTPWQQLTWDGNDTVLDAGNTWFATRQSNAVPTPSAQDLRAATLTQAHAGTPGIVHFDTLGRPAIGIESIGAGTEYETMAKLDIEGNPLEITDARGNIAAQNIFDMLGRTLYSLSNDAGARWTVTNAVGNPIRGWDSRRHIVTSKYDVLHRRTELWVLEEPDPALPPPQIQPDPKLAEQTIYGESLALPAAMNHRGKVYQVKDGAGVVTNVGYDFKGNLLEAQRQLAAAFNGQLDWSVSVTLETETFVQQTQYDALNRPTSMTMPYALNAPNPPTNVMVPTYNEAGLLERVDATIRGAATSTTFVDDIDYDAKGQRERIVYGNGVQTEYEYDELTYRVKRIKTTRTADSVLLQDLRYYYDAVGNIVEMADLAQSSVNYNNQVAEPVWQYDYDAIYRLIHATGREHAGQNADIQQDAYGFPLVNAPNPNDLQAMRNYAETYQYDEVGNFIEMIHAAMGGTGTWTRRYEISTTSNRLLGTSIPGDALNQYSERYLPDPHGNMTQMSQLPPVLDHLPTMEWDFKDQLAHVVKSGAGDVYFTYDGSGQRVRKVWVHNGITEERIYLGGFELYRRHENGGIVLERETLHIMDDTRRIAMVETKTIDTSVPNLNVASRTRYQCSNHLGSATLELDETGQVISYEEYHPYGTSAYRATNGSVEVSAKRYRYTGKERDEETGLYYHGARYYACWLGRWTSADPAGMVDGPNLFQYVGGRPVGSNDPSGMTEVATANTGIAKAFGVSNGSGSSLAVYEGKISTTPQGTHPAPAESPKLGMDPFSDVSPDEGRAIEVGDAVLSLPPTDPGGRHALAEYLGSSSADTAISARDAAMARIESSVAARAEKIDSHNAFLLRLQVVLENEGILERRILGSTGALPTAVEADPMGGFRPAAPVRDISQPMAAVRSGPFQLNLVPHIGGGIAARGPNGERVPPFNPSNSRQNCVSCVIAFINSVTAGERIQASGDYAMNDGSIGTANDQIIQQTGARLGRSQGGLETKRSRQLFVVYPGTSINRANHVLVGTVTNGKAKLYDPQTGARYANPAQFGRFVAFPIMPSGRLMQGRR